MRFGPKLNKKSFTPEYFRQDYCCYKNRLGFTFYKAFKNRKCSILLMKFKGNSHRVCCKTNQLRQNFSIISFGSHFVEFLMDKKKVTKGFPSDCRIGCFSQVLLLEMARRFFR